MMRDMRNRETFVRLGTIAARIAWRLARRDEISSEAAETVTRSSNQPEGIADGLSRGEGIREGRREERAPESPTGNPIQSRLGGKVARDSSWRGSREREPARALGMENVARVWACGALDSRLRPLLVGCPGFNHRSSTLLAHSVSPPHHAATTINTNTVG
jgi:hypothetical protein